jgi:hypothetical protein
MGFLEWLSALGQDADPVKAGFQAQGMYLFVCVAGPVLFGAVVGVGLTLIERAFGLKLSQGGH